MPRSLLTVVLVAVMFVLAGGLAGCTARQPLPGQTGETPDQRLDQLAALDIPSNLEFPDGVGGDVPAVALGRWDAFDLVLRLRQGRCAGVLGLRGGAVSALEVDAPDEGQRVTSDWLWELPPAAARAMGPAESGVLDAPVGPIKIYCGSRGMEVAVPAAAGSCTLYGSASQMDLPASDAGAARELILVGSAAMRSAGLAGMT
jgi:hypothetical protein